MSTERFARILDVLELLVGHPQGMTVTEVSKRLNVPISSTHNLLHRLVAIEAVSADDGLRYSLGVRSVRLGIRIVDGLEFRTIARPHLQKLAQEIGEDVYLAIRLGDRVVYVDRLEGSGLIAVGIRLGQALSLHATSVGKLFSAYNLELQNRILGRPLQQLTSHTLVKTHDLEKEFSAIRRNGYAISREEAIIGIVGLAIPVHDARGELIAAVHVSLLSGSLDSEREKKIIDATVSACSLMERELGRL